MTRSITIIAALLTIWLSATVERAEASCGDYVVSGKQLDHLKRDPIAADLPTERSCHGPNCQQRSQPNQAPAVPPTSGEHRQEASNSHEFLQADTDRDPPTYDSYESGLWDGSFYPRVERPPRNV